MKRCLRTIQLGCAVQILTVVWVVASLLTCAGCFNARFHPDGFASDSVNDQQDPTDLAPGDANLDTTADAQDSESDLADTTDVEPLPPLSFGGSIGPVPEGPFRPLGKLVVRNEGQDRSGLATSGIPLSRAENVTDISRLVLLDSTGTRWRKAQFRVLSRWRTDDATPESQRPVRWLQVTFLAGFKDQDEPHEALLRYYDQAPQLPTPGFYDLKLKNQGNLTLIDSGLALFVLNPRNPALLEQIDARSYPDGQILAVYRHQAGAGPRLQFSGKTIQTLAQYDESTTTNDGVLVDPHPDDPLKPDFEIVESGPLRIVVKLRGHFIHPDAKVDCSANNLDDPIDRFGFTTVMTFTAGIPFVDFEFNLRNECGSGLSNFSDQSVTVDKVGWVIPLAFTPTQIQGSLALDKQLGGPYEFPIEVAQLKGSNDGSGWQRQALLREIGAPKPQTLQITSATLPLVALANDRIVTTLQMPWMRYREPQSLLAAVDRLEMNIVSQTTTIGEARGIWGIGRLGLFSLAQPDPLAQIADFMVLYQLELERGLLVRRPLELVNQSGVFPHLGDKQTQSSLKQQYESVIGQFHNDTIDETDPLSSWLSGQTFGSQLWPDTLLDSGSLPFDTPFDNPGSGNLGCVSCSELLEFFRSGDPKWVWDLAMPQSYLLLYSAWYNTGKQPSRFNGYSVGQGKGEGNWHRPSGDWMPGLSNNPGIKLAYVLRPSPLMLDRFVQAADAFKRFYDKPRTEQDDRKEYQRVEFSSLSTGLSGENLFQYLEMLQNCAEFVLGPKGDACLTTLNEIYDELVAENIVDKTACAGDPAPTNSCLAKSYRMLSLLGYRVIYRYITALRPNSATSTALRGMLVQSARQLIETLIPRQPDNMTLDLSKDWLLAMQCSISAGKLQGCLPTTDTAHKIDPAQRPGLLSSVFIAAELDPTFKPCEILGTALNDLNMYAGWLTRLASSTGWDADSAEMFNSVIFAVGGLDRCISAN